MITLYGRLDNPNKLVKNFDVFLLPSYSEGTSRAAMEALYLGLPCVMRDVDSNSDLIKGKGQGFLITNYNELYEICCGFLSG